MTNNDKLALIEDCHREISDLKRDIDRCDAIGTTDYLFLLQSKLKRQQIALAALMAERDADKKRIAELEDRTLSVKIKPPTIGRAYSALAHVWTVQEVHEACAAAGIKLEVGE